MEFLLSLSSILYRGMSSFHPSIFKEHGSIKYGRKRYTVIGKRKHIDSYVHVLIYLRSEVLTKGIYALYLPSACHSRNWNVFITPGYICPNLQLSSLSKPVFTVGSDSCSWFLFLLFWASQQISSLYNLKANHLALTTMSQSKSVIFSCLFDVNTNWSSWWAPALCCCHRTMIIAWTWPVSVYNVT